MRVACCGQIPLVEGGVVDACAALLECVQKLGMGNVDVQPHDVPLDVVDAAADTKADEPLDLVVCGVGLRGISSVQLACDVRETGSLATVVVCAEDDEQARLAYDLGFQNVVAVPAQRADVQFVLERALRDVRECEERAITLRMREGARRICPSRLLYVETVDHDQVAHLSDGTTCSMRIASQAFFELLEPLGQFFKAGSSYIVNVRKVQRLDASTSTATMCDGAAIPIPGRVRKALEEAIVASAK